jgi:hypothetical protein
VTARPRPKEKYLLLVLSLSFVLGMAIAAGVYLAWRSGAIAPGLQNAWSALALVVCPSFVLAVAAGAAPGSDFAVVLIAGTIVFANGCLYAGAAAGGYFLIGVMRKNERGRRRV